MRRVPLVAEAVEMLQAERNGRPKSTFVLPVRPGQKILGHSTISMTERYGHLSDEFVFA